MAEITLTRHKKEAQESGELQRKQGRKGGQSSRVSPDNQDTEGTRWCRKLMRVAVCLNCELILTAVVLRELVLRFQNC